MAITVYKTFAAGETLTASDQNSSFSKIVDNGEDLAWPATKAKDLDGNELILDSDADTSITADTDDQIDFRIGGVDTFKMNATAMTSTVQPAFLYYNATTILNVTGNGTEYTCPFDTKVHDQGSDFTLDTTYTAAVGGVHLLCANIQISGLTVNTADSGLLRIHTSNRSYYWKLVRSGTMPTIFSATINVPADMDAGDTALAKITVSGDTGDVGDFTGGASLHNFFAGVLLT